MKFLKIEEYSKMAYGRSHLDKKTLENFLRLNKIKKFAFGDCLNLRVDFFSNTRLKSRFHYSYKTAERFFSSDPPKKDHGTFFKDEYENVYFVYQPYEWFCNINENTFKDIHEWCEYYGLKCKIFTPNYSWYYKDVTWLMVVTLPDVNPIVSIHQDK